MDEMIAIINGDMIGTAEEPYEYVDWNEPEILSESEWNDCYGIIIDEFARECPHMIVFVVE